VGEVLHLAHLSLKIEAKELVKMVSRLSEKLAVAATIDPDAYASGVQWTDNIDMQDFSEAMFILLYGTGVTTGTATLALYEDTTDGTGTGAQAITAKAATALTTGNNDGQAVINIKDIELSAGYRYVRGRLLLSTAGADAGVVGIASAPRYHPANAYDLASVAQIVG
jgi:hypothetical protein